MQRVEKPAGLGTGCVSSSALQRLADAYTAREMHHARAVLSGSGKMCRGPCRRGASQCGAAQHELLMAQSLPGSRNAVKYA
jgi:hypothetical protein